MPEVTDNSEELAQHEMAADLQTLLAEMQRSNRLLERVAETNAEAAAALQRLEGGFSSGFLWSG